MAMHHCLKQFLPTRKFTLNAAYVFIKALPVVSVCLSNLSALAQKYPASAIPDSLKENADVVVRRFATYKTRYNNKSIFINSVNAALYDASGKEIRHFKKKDMEDQPVYDGSSFVNDERFKVGGFGSQSYPYTVEFEEEDEMTELIGINDWYPQASIKRSVEKSVYGITVPSDYNLRFKMLNSAIKPRIEENGNKKIYTWEIHNLPAYEDAPYVNFLNYTPNLMIGLSEVEMGGYKGNMSTWNEYARFYGRLQKGRDVLPEETRQKVHALTDGIKDPDVKVAVLYNYLQQNSHYVGIQLGIGGWQTYDASYVATKKYGDCKALSNFMISLLKEAGIKGHAVVIRGGPEKKDFVTDFTHDPFNHIICCVPLGKDTIWLECTSQSLPVGYLSEFTANRYGLLIDDDGGSLVHTPAYLLSDNLQIRKISAVLDNEGDLDLDCKTFYKALCQDDIESIIHGTSKDDQLTRLKSEFNLPTYDVISFEYKEDNSKRLPVIEEALKLKVNGYAQITGKRIFINPNILTRASEKMVEDKNRRFDIQLEQEYKYIDTIRIKIPAGYEMESGSTDMDIVTRYGKYIKKTLLTGNQLIYYRSREQYSGRFPGKDYGDILKFFNDIFEADHTRIVLVKKS
jgi:hypothetical protein